MSYISMAPHLEKFDSRYELVLLAARRARELLQGADSKVPRNRDKMTIVALREMAEGAVTVDSMREAYIKSLLTTGQRNRGFHAPSETREALNTHSHVSQDSQQEDSHQSTAPSKTWQEQPVAHKEQPHNPFSLKSSKRAGGLGSKSGSNEDNENLLQISPEQEKILREGLKSDNVNPDQDQL